MSLGRCTCQIGLRSGKMLVLFVFLFSVDAFNIAITVWKRNQNTGQLNGFSRIIHK